jgi:hypothetical protein
MMPTQENIVMTLFQALILGDETRTSRVEHLQIALIATLPAGLQQYHPDLPASLQSIPDHFPVAGLKDVKREKSTRKQNHIRQREDGNLHNVWKVDYVSRHFEPRLMDFAG